MKASEANKKDTKLVFLTKGTCSYTMFYILDQEFGHSLELEEHAAEPLAGGILQNGYQCGLIWGAAMGAGAEAYHRTESLGKSIALSINTSAALLDSFTNRAQSSDCEDIVNTDLTGKGSALKLLITGKFVTCLRLADKWAPEAIRVAKEALSQDQNELAENSLSCTSELVRQMGGTEQQMAIVAGLAGGLGLSGNACGVLAAAIWMNTLKHLKENNGKADYLNPAAQKTMNVFLDNCESEFLCQNICSRKFNSLKEHSEYIENGGCQKLITALASA